MKKVSLFLLMVLMAFSLAFIGCGEEDDDDDGGGGLKGGNLPSDGKLGIGIVGATGWNGSQEKALVKEGKPSGDGFGIDVVETTDPITINFIYKTPTTMATLNPPQFDGDTIVEGKENDEGKEIITIKGVTLAITKVVNAGTSPSAEDFTVAKVIGDIVLKAHWWSSGSELEADPIALADAFTGAPSLANNTATKQHWTIQLSYTGVEINVTVDEPVVEPSDYVSDEFTVGPIASIDLKLHGVGESWGNWQSDNLASLVLTGDNAGKKFKGGQNYEIAISGTSDKALSKFTARIGDGYAGESDVETTITDSKTWSKPTTDSDEFYIIRNSLADSVGTVDGNVEATLTGVTIQFRAVD
jgi:hypothetical protein